MLERSVNNCHFQTRNMNIFKSFWMGGFECSDQINCFGKRVNLLKETKHIDLLVSDYKLLLDTGIFTVREGVQWSVAEIQPYYYNFDTVKIMMETGRSMGMQQVWDLCHFGFPSDLSPLHPEFTKRFVSYCAAFANFVVKNFGKIELIITPINEVSFLSWLGGDAAGTTPFCNNEGWNVKYKLMQAYIEGIRTLKTINKNFKILTTEPLVNIVPQLNADVQAVLKAKQEHENQFQVLDILMGKKCPELGGSRDCIDIVGLNYYYNNQWIHNSKEGYFLPWENENSDPRWRSLSYLIEEVYHRYKYPIILSETSHSNNERVNWITYITDECIKVIKSIPFYGICIYPIIDRPDWDNITTWFHSGLWESYQETAEYRVKNLEYANAVLRCQEKVILHSSLTLNSTKTNNKQLNNGNGALLQW